MSKEKKTFIFYNDRQDYTEEMSLEEKGIFLQVILNYQNGKELGDIGPIKFIWSRVKNQLDKDTAARAHTIEGKSEGGKNAMERRRGNRDKDNNKTITPDNLLIDTITPDNLLIDTITPITDNDNDNDNDNDSVNVNVYDNDIISKEKHCTTYNADSESSGKLFEDDTHSLIVAEIQPKKEYGNSDINKLIEIFKSRNQGIVDGTQKEIRFYCNLLLKKAKDIKGVVAGKQTPAEAIDTIIAIVSENQFHSHKVGGPKKMYYALAELMQVCNQTIMEKKKREVPVF